MYRVVLDMDPGIDDAIALLLALNDPGVELAAITTVSGNVSLHKATLNALRIVEAASRRVPVFMGASRPAGGKKSIRAQSVHGSDGLGDAGLDQPTRGAEKIGAVDMLIGLLKSSKRKEISIVATGPLTNIATLVEKEPSLLGKVDRIFVMGGLYDPQAKGNVTEHAEFNFFSDAKSADRVMSSKNIPLITAAGLEVTSHPSCRVDARALEKIHAFESRMSSLAHRILRWPVLTYSYFNLHDVFAFFALVHPEIFTTELCSVRVSHSGKYRGRCSVTSGGGNVLVCRRVVTTRFNQLVLEGLK